MESNKYILAIGANPCWEKMLTFDTLTLGEVNRAKSVDGYAAGKASNFCRALQCLGGLKGRQITFLGGDTGTIFAAALTTEQLEFRAVATHHNTRTCTNCICNGVMTEIVEPGNAIDMEDFGKFLNIYQTSLPNAVGVALCGSIPQGTHPAFALNVALMAQKANLPMLLDNWEAATQVLDTGVSAVLKINASELAKMTKLDSVQDGLAMLRAKYPRLTAGITDGPNTAWLLDPMSPELIKFTLPPLAGQLNPLGAGDTASAVFFSRLLSGFKAADAFADALAAASASCLTNIAGNFSPEAALQYLPQR